MSSKMTRPAAKRKKKRTRADWTVMIYLAGDNSLTDECVYSLIEMQKARRKKGTRINVFAQFDPDDKYLPTSRLFIGKRSLLTGRLGQKIVDVATNTGSGKPRFKVESKATIKREKAIKEARDRLSEHARAAGIDNELLKSMGLKVTISDGLGGDLKNNGRDTDTGDPGTLFDFISRGIERYPAYHYMVVLAGHGDGTEDDFLMKDNSSGHALSIPNLSEVFRQIQEDFEQKDPNKKGPVIDILGMDACCMSMAEVAYELRNHVSTIVASESYSPAAGWPYREIIEALAKFSGKQFRESQDVQARFAKAIVEEFINFYADYTLGGLSVDLAALNMSGADELKEEVKKLATHLGDALRQDKLSSAEERRFKEALLLAHWEAQSYSGELFVDLQDFCERLKKHCQLSRIKKACTKVIDFLKSDRFVISSAYSGPAFQCSHGVSIYFPWANLSPFYEDILFAKESESESGSGWANFLRLYTNQTRREAHVDPKIAKDLSILTLEVLSCNNKFNNASNANVATPTAHANNRQVVGRQVSGRQVVGRQVVGKGSENPISSMRNPPLVYLPDKRIRAKVPLIEAQRKLLVETDRRNGSHEE